MRVIILIPTYNEAENIRQLLRELNVLSKKMKKYTVRTLFVDDNSPDGTGKIISKWAKNHHDVVLLSGRKKGLGRAMVRGYRYAMDKLNADVVITNEADFAFDLKHVPYMLKSIDEGFDVVVASRHVGAGNTEGWTISRRANHWIANTVFATWVAGVSEVHDHNGAFRAIRVPGVLDKIELKALPVSGFGFFFLLIHRLSQVTDKFHEFPVTYKFRTNGESKVSFNPKYIKTYLHDVMEYMSLAFQIRRERSRISNRLA